jgi:hypothetical protein
MNSKESGISVSVRERRKGRKREMRNKMKVEGMKEGKGE